MNRISASCKLRKNGKGIRFTLTPSFLCILFLPPYVLSSLPTLSLSFPLSLSPSLPPFLIIARLSPSIPSPSFPLSHFRPRKTMEEVYEAPQDDG